MKVRIFTFALLIIAIIVLIVPINMANIHTQCKSNAEQLPTEPLERKSNYTYTNKTIIPYPVVNSSSQKPASFNNSLFQEMLSLTILQPEIWRSFILNQNDIFLAVDGASQSRVLRVLIELYSPDSSLVSAKNTTSSDPFHKLIRSPSTGTWQIHLKLLDTGNTTVWVQAVSYTNGARYVSDYQKERIHLYAGQALYFKIPYQKASDWFYIYCVKLAGAYVYYDLYKPLEYERSWISRSNTFEGFYCLKNLPSNGIYLLIITNGGDADVTLQLTIPNGVSRTLTPSDRFVIKFSIDQENELFYLNVNTKLAWMALDGAVTTRGSWGRYRLIDPDMNSVTDQTSDSVNRFISKILVDPLLGKYILILTGSADAKLTVQFTSSGDEDNAINVAMDEKITFTQSGQTLYYRVPTVSNMPLLFVATSLTSGVTQYRIFDFRMSQVWSQYSSGPSEPRYAVIAAVGGDYIIQVQGQTDTDVMLHFRFEDDHDFLLYTPDYSDFKIRFDGDMILCKIVVKTASSYLAQFWHSLSNDITAFWIHNPNFQGMGSGYFDDVNDESRFLWTINNKNFVSGNWIIVITGRKNAAVRVSQLQSGEERIVNTPFHIFETFDFNYQVKTFVVNVHESKWFSLVAQSQTDSRFYLQVYDSKLEYKWYASGRYKEDTSHGFWRSPATGSWLIIIDGLQNTNLSLTFFTSIDVMLIRQNDYHYTEEFTYYGHAKYYKIDLNSSILGFDAMWLTQNIRVYTYVVDLEGNIVHSYSSSTQFDVTHKLIVSPQNGTWYLILIGCNRAKVIYRLTTIIDRKLSFPFANNFCSEFDGQVTYVSFNVTGIDQLKINITSNSDTDTYLWLHDPNGQQRYSYRFYAKNQFTSLSVNNPSEGRWLLCLVQEVFANVSISCGGYIKPLPKPLGILIQFIFPPDAQVYVRNENITLLPELKGTINVVVNVTDYYHPITDVRLYYNAGSNFTTMTLNRISGFYEASFDTTKLPDGLHELVVFAKCQSGEIGIASISMFINNNGTFSPIDDCEPPIIVKILRNPDSEEIMEYQKVEVSVEVADKDTAVSLVILRYSTDGQTWENITMIRVDKCTFLAYIPGYPAGTRVMYEIIAYDYVGNYVVDNKSYEYYTYNIVPEFPTSSILTIMLITTTLIMIITQRSRRKGIEK